ncbi:MAG: amidophosphoribosyltransferase [Saprospiraceae bacterium]|nr:amidophosphoribosyltransferase [Saprospiraceae bacterium]
MSDQIKHECGVAFVRLLKPLEYYQEKYGTAFYGLDKLQILMQKQRNRGQDGAGVATIKMDIEPGHRYISRKRMKGPDHLSQLFTHIFSHFDELKPEQYNDAQWLKNNKPYIGELYLGHLRYGTFGLNTVESVQPFLRLNNWITRNLVLAGNFNLTNVNYLFDRLVSYGQFPKEKSDTVTVLEKIGHFLDEEVDHLFNWFKPEGYSKQEINPLIYHHLDVNRILQRACRKFDGGFSMVGLIGHGDAFMLRDPSGIRPAFYYHDDEIVVGASERPAIQTALGVRWHEINELQPGHSLIVKYDGRVDEKPCLDANEKRSCSFERIYFSRGNDRDIYLERKDLGRQLVKPLLEEIENDFDNTVFSFIPNTAETSFYGLMEGLTDAFDLMKTEQIAKADGDTEKIKSIIQKKPRYEKLVVKDAKMRTFITDEANRGNLVSHVYDVTYGVVRDGEDTIVLIDDSIVRGTTLRDSIVRIVSRLRPKKIVVLSSAPQIRYPDCYGIDMSRMRDFVAFQALISLLEEDSAEHLLDETYARCKDSELLDIEDVRNEVKELYDRYDYEIVSRRIAELLTPEDLDCELHIIFQSLEGLSKACPHHTGDWYFSGNYPTPGGNRVVNRAFINYMEKSDRRAYA